MEMESWIEGCDDEVVIFGEINENRGRTMQKCVVD